MEAKNLEKKAIGIVAQLFDLAEVPLDKRQEINDIAYDYVAKQLALTDVIKQRELLSWMKKNHHLGKTEEQINELLLDYNFEQLNCNQQRITKQ
tara:strand:+ start:168 stop:449 length:282 start_codon:yes stop_codon:yes gene_type:complete